MELPVLLFFYFDWFSWKGRSLQWDTTGFDTFINISKFPLTLLALILPLTALVASWHRSIQTAKQIEETQVKNTADLYYAHLKFFIDRLEGNELASSPIQLHKALYPNFSASLYSTLKDETINLCIKKLLENFNKTIDEWIKEGSSSNNLTLLNRLSDTIKNANAAGYEWMSVHHITFSSIEFKFFNLELTKNEDKANEIINKALSDLESLSDIVGM